MICSRVFVCGAVLACLINIFPATAQTASQDAAPDAPAQPIAFSHKVHAGTLKLPCKMCHPNPDPGEMMTIAAPSTCMKCHSAIKADSPEIKKLAEFASSGRPIPWARVYEIPSFVNFSHRIHTDKGNTCQECHGQVAARDRLFRETNLSMAGCIDCHKAKKASVDCSVCHDLQN
jgi:hypothetical protein